MRTQQVLSLLALALYLFYGITNVHDRQTRNALSSNCFYSPKFDHKIELVYIVIYWKTATVEYSKNYDCQTESHLFTIEMHFLLKSHF